MARIRTVKPEFFRHDLLQDLEMTHPGSCPMLVFAGLWGHCDKAGRFLWRPKHLKLDILPFLPFDMANTLTILEQAGLLKKYSVSGLEYGLIPSFVEHQRIGGKEAQEPEKFPSPNSEAKGKKRGSAREATGKQSGLQEGKGREGNKEGNGDMSGLAPDVAQPASKNSELRQQAAEVIGFLNAKAGRNFDVNGVNADHVVARLKEGATLADCRAVIALKVRQWLGNPEMVTYLRPETLFNRTKFASYKGELGTSDESQTVS